MEGSKPEMLRLSLLHPPLTGSQWQLTETPAHSVLIQSGSGFFRLDVLIFAFSKLSPEDSPWHSSFFFSFFSWTYIYFAFLFLLSYIRIWGASLSLVWSPLGRGTGVLGTGEP